LPEVHMAETFALSVLNHDIKVASKAARIVLAARGRPVLEFGTRRTHHEAAVKAARAAYLAGFTATSNVEAGRRYGIPVAGTMSHMWVMVSKSETRAFNDFRDVYKAPVLLIDTYDTDMGAVYASQIPMLSGVRLDSGNLETLSKKVRGVLDSNGKQSAKIIVSNDLNEYKIDSLARCGAPIDTFAVGTELVISKDVPSLGVVYKVVYDDTDDRPLVKLSAGKKTFPGRKQVFLDQRNGEWKHLLAIEGEVEQEENLTPLLDCNIKNGEVVKESVVDLEVSRKYCNAALINLHSNLASLELEEIQVPVHPDKSLEEMFRRAMQNESDLG
jgi:nicotinate phosphoribosyltransferase